MNRWQKKIHREVMCSLRIGSHGDMTYKQIRRSHRIFHSVLKEVDGEMARRDMLPSIVVQQECNCCGKLFWVEYYSNGKYAYRSVPCECEDDFSPVDGPSISQWLATL